MKRTKTSTTAPGEIKRTNLQSALEIVKPGLANKEIIEQSTAFAFLGDRVVTYNDEISISHPVENMLDVVGAVQAEELYKYLNRIKSETIETKLVENELRIITPTGRAGLVLHEEVKLPLDEIGAIGRWKKLPKDFKDALKYTIATTSSDMSNAILTCINITKEGIIESSDNFQLTRYETAGVLPTYLLPARTAQILVRYNIMEVARGSRGWVHFRTDADTIISCRIFEEEFPDISFLLDVEGMEVEFPKEMHEIVERAEIFAKRDFSFDEFITVVLDDKKLILRSQSDAGWFEESIDLEHTVEHDIQFNINPTFLKNILKHKYTAIVGETSIKIEGDGWILIATLQD